MRPAELSSEWYASPYTGLFSECGPVPRFAHDPDVPIWSGVAPLPDHDAEPPASGGAGWDEANAEAAAVGEAIERWQSWPLPCDQVVTASVRDWPRDEPAIGPSRWVLFHAEQYALPNFPYQPFTNDTVCRWVCVRDAVSGSPYWVPEELVYLSLPSGRFAQLCPLISSGMSCGRWVQPVLLRGLQEAIERDAAVGASWGRYALEEYDAAQIFAYLDDSDDSLPPLRGEGRVGGKHVVAADVSIASRLQRPNLRYRFFRVATPFCAHVTIATLEGEDRCGYVYSVGAACRETRSGSWQKSLLEAVQGRHYVRYLKEQYRQRDRRLDVPASFAEHALYYSVHPERLRETVLGRPANPGSDVDANCQEGLSELFRRLGPQRPVLFRNLTPPGLAMERLDWYVLRVLVPGLQPLHGHHALPFLGSPLWSPRTWRDWADMPPHPFP